MKEGSIRRKASKFLYDNNVPRLNKIYTRTIGKTKIDVKKNNVIKSSYGLFYNNAISVQGGGERNVVLLGENISLTNSTILIKGSGNFLDLRKDCYLNGVKIIVEGDDNAVIIGENVSFVNDVRLFAVGGRKMIFGNGSIFSDRIDVRTSDHHSVMSLETGKRINYERDVIIGEKVWVCSGVTILKGSEIGDNSIIGARSVVAGLRSRPNTIIAGNPAKEIKSSIYWEWERLR